MGLNVQVLARPEGPNGGTDALTANYLPQRVRPFSLRMVEEDAPSAQISALLRREQFDLVHFHMALDLPLHFLSGFARMGVPYVVSLHDYFYICPRIFMVDFESQVCRHVDLEKCRRCVGWLDQNDVLRGAARRLGLVLPRVPSSVADRRIEAMKRFLQRAELLLPVSTRTAQIYRQVIPEGRFQVERIGNQSATLEPPAKTKSNAIRLVATGTLCGIKGAGILEQIMRRVRRSDVEFHFYGRTLEGYDERLQRLGLKCHGDYSPTDLPIIMANSDIGLVMPIWEDAGPQVAMEFINNFVPVLGTRRGGIPDIVSEDAGFLFDPCDICDLERAVAWIEALDRAKIDEISARIARLITPETHARRIVEIYSELLANRHGTGTEASEQSAFD
jgi:glycosyltransferase involved in cell wall biosynthesis